MYEYPEKVSPASRSNIASQSAPSSKRKDQFDLKMAQFSKELEQRKQQNERAARRALEAARREAEAVRQRAEKEVKELEKNDLKMKKIEREIDLAAERAKAWDEVSSSCSQSKKAKPRRSHNSGSDSVKQPLCPEGVEKIRLSPLQELILGEPPIYCHQENQEQAQDCSELYHLNRPGVLNRPNTDNPSRINEAPSYGLYLRKATVVTMPCDYLPTAPRNCDF